VSVSNDTAFEIIPLSAGDQKVHSNWHVREAMKSLSNRVIEQMACRKGARICISVAVVATCSMHDHSDNDQFAGFLEHLQGKFSE